MYATLLADARFHELLLAIDRDLADAARAQGCGCGGRLHLATYPRKPRGRPQSVTRRLEPEHDRPSASAAPSTAAGDANATVGPLP